MRTACKQTLLHGTEQLSTTPSNRDLFFISNLACLGSWTLVLRHLTSDLDLSEVEQRVTNLAGYVSSERRPHDSDAGFDLFIQFGTAMEAAVAANTEPPFNVGTGQRTLEHVLDDLEDELPRKKAKVSAASSPNEHCSICGDNLTDQYARPCLTCRKIYCHECLSNQFNAALSDIQLFPARCCGRVIHFDVARGVLEDARLQRYKLLFEERHTTKPVYCANPICSTFLPARVARPNSRGQVGCPGCDQVTCVECKTVVVDASTHVCTNADATKALLTQFDYKRCPRCNAGVAKMHGCSHMRCQCGAHWCWDCRRAIQVCWARPCRARAEEDGYDYDYEEERRAEEEAEAASDDETDSQGSGETPAVDLQTAELDAVAGSGSNTVDSNEEPLAAQTATPQPETVTDSTTSNGQAVAGPSNAAANVSTPAPVEPVVNLDGEDYEDWEGGFDFGDEPVDEGWDIWGCHHAFEPIHDDRLWKGLSHWLPTTFDGQTGRPSKMVDCMRCYRPVVLVEPTPSATSRRDSACDVTEPAAQSTGTTSNSTEQKDKGKKKAKKTDVLYKMYDCRSCGVVYCPGCHKKALKEQKASLAATGSS